MKLTAVFVLVSLLLPTALSTQITVTVQDVSTLVDAAVTAAEAPSERDQLDPKFVVGLLKPEGRAHATPGLRVVQMTGPGGVRYQCHIPDPNQNETRVEEPPQEAAELTEKHAEKQLVKALRKRLGKGCFTKTVEYWTYEVCPFRKTSQYHKEGNEKGLEFSLGSYDPAKDGFTDSFDYTQTFVDGTGGRESLVTYVCKPPAKGMTKKELRNSNLLTTIREPQERVYHLEIQTYAACVDAVKRRRRAAMPFTPMQLLRPLENQCVSQNSGWWTYKFCFLRDVAQFHKEQIPDENSKEAKFVTTVEYDLGRLPKSVDLDSSLTLHKGATTEETYMSQLYEGGTQCDVGGKQSRQTEVRFYCDPEEAHKIRGVKEVASCTYVLNVVTRLLCEHEAFEPKRRKVNEIVCEPVVRDVSK